MSDMSTPEPTLADVLTAIGGLSAKVEALSANHDTLAEKVDTLADGQRSLGFRVDEMFDLVKDTAEEVLKLRTSHEVLTVQVGVYVDAFHQLRVRYDRDHPHHPQEPPFRGAA